jgi:hypothetical protein
MAKWFPWAGRIIPHNNLGERPDYTYGNIIGDPTHFFKQNRLLCRTGHEPVKFTPEP